MKIRFPLLAVLLGLLLSIASFLAIAPNSRALAVIVPSS